MPEAVGTRVGELIGACDQPFPRPSRPPRTPEPTVAVALSGGGFRATLAGVGVLRFLADAGLAERIRYSSSVSGGSIANAMFATRYADLARAGVAGEAFTELVEGPLVQRISSSSLTLKLLANAWKTVGPATRTTVLADALDSWFFHGTRLRDLPSECRFIFNAANLDTGVRFGLEREVVGDWVVGNREPGELRVADAVAASAAVPGFFARYDPGGSFPCADGSRPQLVDGGAYDNLGLEPLDRLPDTFLVSLNAGGVFRTGPYGRIPIIRDLQRSNALLYRQSTTLRMRTMVERFQAYEEAVAAGQPPPPWGRWGVLFALATTMEAAPEWSEARPEHPDWTDDLARVKTTFNRFNERLCRRLVYRGWWLTGAAITTYHRSLLGDALPQWRGVTPT